MNALTLADTLSASDAETRILQAQVHETGELRQRMTDLLAEVAQLRQTSQPDLSDLVLQLREANQHLLIATVGAQSELSSAEAANRRQEQFLSMLAHELRNPLAPMAMAVQLLGKLLPGQEQLPRLHGILARQVAHMTHLVDDLLDASRISSGKIMLQRRAVLLSEVIEHALETSQPAMDRRHQHFSLSLPFQPVWIHGDLVRLAQVFANLLINAAKFSPEYEEISIAARRQRNAVLISVQDHGIGIAAEQQSSIFDLFTQGYQLQDRSQGGLGIGLSLVRTIVELHEGTVSVSSAGLGLGSVFTVLLPIGEAPAPVAPAEDHLPPLHPVTTRAPGLSILLIEDNLDTNDTLGDLLQQEGHIITCAEDGPGGLALARQHVYDAIVCDIGMPGMSGFDVARQLRLQQLRPMPCLIALTGYNQSEHRTRALEAGFDHYLMKPVAIDMLLKLISSCVRQ